MKARFLNVQEFDDGSRKVYKLRYSANPENPITKFTGDDDREKVVVLRGEKVFEIKATATAFDALQFAETGDMLDFAFEPDPANPRYNVVVGLHS